MRSDTGPEKIVGDDSPLPRSKSFKAIVFDIDGTLLNTLEDIADSMNGALAGLGFPVHELESYKHFVGDGMETLVRRSLPDPVRNDPQQVAQCLKTLLQIYDRSWHVKSRPYPGIPELLDELTARGIRMTVLSNKLHDFAVKTVEQLLPAWRFELILGERPGIPRKPDPSAALEIARRLAIEPAEFLYLGDTAIDMKTALGAGMFAAGALWGFRDARELTASGAEKLLAHPVELLQLLL